MSVMINEVMAKNRATVIEENGDAYDWIELYNPGSSDANLCGYTVTNRLADPRVAHLGPEVVVPAGGHVVVWLTEDGGDRPFHAAMKLSVGGGELGLADPDGIWLDRLVYGAQEVDFSAAREPDGSDRWVIEWHASPGAANPSGDGAPVGAEDPGAPPEEIPAAGDLTEVIMGYDRMPAIGIEIAPADMELLRVYPRTYVPAHLIYDGRRYGPVGLRLKGGNSFLPIDEKPSLRINVNEYIHGAEFFGLKDMTLNNMSEDFSMVHERLAYFVARHVGPASRSNHALVTVNDQFYGLYTNLETVKDRILARWFDDNAGPLFEATDVDFAPQYIDAFELQDGPDDRRLLEAAAQALTDTQPDRAIAAASEFVNMGSFFAYWAMVAVIAQFDAFPYSVPGDDYFVYADPGTDQLWFMPWGMDETFYSAEHDVLQVSSILATTCLAVSTCRQAFVSEVWATLRMVEDLDWKGELERIVAEIAPHVTMDRRKPYADAMVAEFQQQMRWFISGRRITLEAMLGPATQ
ncbi:MAG TPA: CotH kinase family protein [Kofleriaceae bacterium]|nr:CotH kinase family protein [Kofleriaceae bacterium]